MTLAVPSGGAVPDDIRDELSAKTMLVHLTDQPERIGEHLKLLDAHGVSLRQRTPMDGAIRQRIILYGGPGYPRYFPYALT
jgi:hypothetical protein